MEAITVEQVCKTAKDLLSNNHRTAQEGKKRFTELSSSFFVDKDFEKEFRKLGLTTIDSVFSFKAAENLSKDNLAGHRSRLRFEISSPPVTVFLKRYERPPVASQLGNWLRHNKRTSFGRLEFELAKTLASAGVSTPKTIAYGEQWGSFFEKRSFIITKKLPIAESLERKLPEYFEEPATAGNLKLRRDFVRHLAAFIKKFHETGHCHRDLYFSHIFHSSDNQFYLIDLARVFKPNILYEHFLLKDITQIYYSAPGKYFSRTDRLRFYLTLTGQDKLTSKDKAFICKVINKANRMARHDLKHGRTIPFAN
jgi:hypothetical protein